MSSDFYSRRAEDYSAYYNLNGSPEQWAPESKELHSIGGINEFFNLIAQVIRNGSVKSAFDLGIGPAAREIIRYLEYGWVTYGCDISESVIQSAKRQLTYKLEEPITNIFNADLRNPKDFAIIKGLRFDLISCLNVIQHLVGQCEVSCLMNFLDEYTSSDGYVLILFKRSDYNTQDAQKRGLIIKGNPENNGMATYYDSTFKEFRDYSIFDTSYLASELRKIGFKPIDELQQYSQYRFYNTRNYPCSFLVMKRTK
jgi:hypothetical protein